MIRLLRSLGVALLLAVSAGAAPFTTSFDALRAEMQTRRDNDYGGTLTSAQRREVAALDACLARLDGAHASIGDDAKSLKFTANKLVKAFRGQFTGGTAGPFPALLSGTVTSLLAEAETVYGTLGDAIAAAAIPENAAEAQRLADDARGLLDDASLPGTSQAAAAALIGRAVKLIVKALAIAAERPPSGVRCKLGGSNFASDDISFGSLLLTDADVMVSFQANRGDDRLQVQIRGPVGEPQEVGAFQPPFTDDHVLYADGPGDEDFFFSQFRDVPTFAVILTVDAATGSATGRFEAYVQRNVRDRLVIQKGTFNVSGLTVTDQRSP